MSDRSANLSLPYLMPSQAQKHVTHNEAIALLDALVQLVVISATQGAAPDTAAEGDRYLVPIGAGGAWSGQDGAVAIFSGGAWMFLVPRVGWQAWAADAGHGLRFDGTAWMIDAPATQGLAMVGVNTTADATNRLSVAAGATLLGHAGAGHQLKINKAAPGDTASLLFQTAWSGRAEMGTVGTDDFVFKVSADGTQFHVALTSDSTTGAVEFPNGASVAHDLGTGPVIPLPHLIARHGELFANSFGTLPNGYNYPPAFVRDPVMTPDLAAAFAYAGYDSGYHQAGETIPVDPHGCYRIACLLRQEGLEGDWSAHVNGERHAQGFGFVCIDADGLPISALHHARHAAGGTDSLTTLAAPLTPGDTQIALTSAAGWNDSDTDPVRLGVVIFGYRDTHGRVYDAYSRIAASGLFQVGGVNKTTHVITLDVPLPAGLGNPQDAGGTWPVGTPIANTDRNDMVKPILAAHVPGASDQWYATATHVGGVDMSGRDVAMNFAPGTVGVRLAWRPNASNQPGGANGFADTGASHRVWIAGASVRTAPLAVTDPVVTGGMAGSHAVFAPVPNIASGQVTLQPAAVTFATRG